MTAPYPVFKLPEFTGFSERQWQLAKYYVPEAESAALAFRLDSEDAVVVSELARVELMSVFHRRMRERKWTRERFQVAAGQFNRDDALKYWSWSPVSSLIVTAASQLYLSLPESVFLRAGEVKQIGRQNYLAENYDDPVSFSGTC